MSLSLTPFCVGPGAVEAFGRWKARLEAAGIELAEPDYYVLGLVASREARLQELVEAVAREADPDRKLRIAASERLAAADMAKALDMLERHYGGAVAEAEYVLQRTGTDDVHVLRFPSQAGLGVMAQRIIAAVKGGALTKAQLRQAVRGSQNAFLAGFRQALAAGALQREGQGSRSRPFLYRAEGT